MGFGVEVVERVGERISFQLPVTSFQGAGFELWVVSYGEYWGLKRLKGGVVEMRKEKMSLESWGLDFTKCVRGSLY